MKLLDNRTGHKAIYNTDFIIDIEGEYLIIYFHADKSRFNSYSDIYNDDLYKGDVCEIFLSTYKDDYYYEIEVAPNGTVFLAEIHNKNGVIKARKIKKNFVISEVKLNEDYYEINIKIPLDKIKYDKEKGIYYNAFRIDTDGEVSDKHLFALSPTLSSTFHRRECFIKF